MPAFATGDIHMIKGEWNRVKYPVVPGHEIAGRVTKVKKYKQVQNWRLSR